MGMPAGFQTDYVAWDVAVSEIICGCFYLFCAPVIVTAVKKSKGPCGNHRTASCKQIILAYNVGDRVSFYDIDINPCRHRDPDAHNQIRILADRVQLRFATGGAVSGARRLTTVVFLLAAVELGISGSIKIHAVALIGYKKRDGGVCFTIAGNGICVDIQS